MALKLMGKKKGMMQFFDDQGVSVPCTVIEVEPNVVVQIKTQVSRDGYDALQLGCDKIKPKRAKKPVAGHYAKGNLEPRRHLSECRIENPEGYSVGQEIGVGALSEFEYVDVIAVSKGKGYQGVMKKYNFSGGPAAHGSGFHRHAGSTGMRSTPGRCFPNSPRPSHMGCEQVTVQSLKVIKIDEKENLVIVKGSVPGATNGLVYLTRAEKKYANR